jgi:hypothetical protein
MVAFGNRTLSDPIVFFSDDSKPISEKSTHIAQSDGPERTVYICSKVSHENAPRKYFRRHPFDTCSKLTAVLYMTRTQLELEFLYTSPSI